MNKPTLKGIDLSGEDPSTYAPEIPGNFCVWLTLSIGREGVEGSDLFQVGVCTIRWLGHQLSAKGAHVLRHMILVESFDSELIKKTIREIIENSGRSSWEESVAVLCRYFAWEFEDYQP